MKKTTLLLTSTLTVSSCLAESSDDSKKTVKIEKKPNVVFFFIDDMGWKDVGFMGSKFYQTPNIDRLANEGIIFTNAYSAAPNCAPSRACLMSGQYGPRHGIYTVQSSARGPKQKRKLIPTQNTTTLDSKVLTMGEMFKSAGYATAHFGKWHLGENKTGPKGQGFDENFGGNHSGHPRTYFSPYKNKQLKDGPKGEYLTDRLADEVCGFMDKNSDKPFFVYFSMYAVHTPIMGKKKLVDKYKLVTPDGRQSNPKYASMVECVDDAVGQVAAKLKELGLDDDTVIVFFSDNGGVHFVTDMSPLRGCKGTLYDGGVKEPMFVRWPKKIKPKKVDEPIIAVDLYPTFMKLAGVEKSKEQVLDGESFVPLLLTDDWQRQQPLFWHFPAYLEGGNEGFWRTTPAGSIRQGDWKLIEFFEDGRLELYNLAKDQGERNNLAKSNPEKCKELLEKMKAWRIETNAPVPTKKNPDYDPNFKGRKRNKRR